MNADASTEMMSTASSERANGVGTGTDLSIDDIKEASGKFDTQSIYSLNLSRRSLQNVSGLSSIVKLVELDLSNNFISQIHGLEGLTKLRKLVMACNRIRIVDGLDQLCCLEHLLLQGNAVATIAGINLPMLSHLKSLKSLYLRNVDGTEACPVCLHKEYKAEMLASLPHLTNLDGERNPRTCAYRSTVEEACQVTEQMKLYKPDFCCSPPKPTFEPGMLSVPPILTLTVPACTTAAVALAQRRLHRLEATLQDLLCKELDRVETINVTKAEAK